MLNIKTKEVEILKPNTLYRGIVLPYQDLNSIEWHDADIKVHYEPKIDEHGRKIIGDGNEYGVYMTDNLDMVLSAYGNPRSNGTALENSPQLIVSGARMTVNAPSVGIVYQINTNGLDIREPFICDQLQGHYNNGFQGKEWISDMIPKENLEVMSVKIARDLLHDEQIIQNDGGDIKERIDDIMSKRLSRLQDLSNELEKLPESKRLRLSSVDMEQYKFIFGENGLKYIDLDNCKIQNAQDAITYMKAGICQKQDVDMKSLQELEKVKSGLSGTSTFGDIQEALAKRLDGLNDKKNEREQSGLSADGIIKSIQRVEDLLSEYEHCLNNQRIDIEELCNGLQEIDLDAIVQGDQLVDMEVELDLGSIEELSDFVREI